MADADGRPTETMRSEHAVLRREASRLARVASGLAKWSTPDTPDQLTAIRGFLYGQLLPHAQAEDAVLYPLMDKAARSSLRSFTYDPFCSCAATIDVFHTRHRLHESHGRKRLRREG
jgi:iron-sulfur cluster repair protein YtfE (RIC family)